MIGLISSESTPYYDGRLWGINPEERERVPLPPLPPPSSLSLVLKEKKRETCADLHCSRYDFSASLRNPAKLLNS